VSNPTAHEEFLLASNIRKDSMSKKLEKIQYFKKIIPHHPNVTVLSYHPQMLQRRGLIYFITMLGCHREVLSM